MPVSFRVSRNQTFREDQHLLNSFTLMDSFHCSLWSPLSLRGLLWNAEIRFRGIFSISVLEFSFLVLRGVMSVPQQLPTLPYTTINHSVTANLDSLSRRLTSGFLSPDQLCCRPRTLQYNTRAFPAVEKLSSPEPPRQQATPWPLTLASYPNTISPTRVCFWTLRPVL